MHLNNHSCFSFRYGTLRPEELIDLAKKCDYDVLALTDINNTSASLSFVRKAKAAGIRPLVGIDFRNGVQQQFVGIARNNHGFFELNAYLSDFLHHKKAFPERAKCLEHAFVIYPFQKFKHQFIELENHEFIGISMRELLQLSFSPWRAHQERFVLLQTVSFNGKRHFNIHRLLRAIDNNTLLSKLNPAELGNPNQQMVHRKELEKQLINYPIIHKNTQYVLNHCEIDFAFKGKQKSAGINHNKKHFTASREEDRKLLQKLCEEGLSYRYPNKYHESEVQNRLRRELSLIFEQDFEAYFLINWDMLRFTREKGFFYVGRGSGANSMVAYLLRITDVDPLKLDLYFERFMNPHRQNPPDFDLDFSWTDRNEVLDYLFDRYGKNGQIALLATYNTFTYRSLRRELGKVFGLPKTEIDDLVAGKQTQTSGDDYHYWIEKYAAYMEGLPSHLSIHAGGVLITDCPIHYYSATNIPPKGYPTVQFDMLDAEDAALYKFDVLSQRGLGKIKAAVDLVKERDKGADFDIHQTAPFFEDEQIKACLRKADTIGCFYIESPAMRSLLIKLKTDHYLGLVAASSIIRPGVAKSGMMREYILRSRDSSEAWRKSTPKLLQELMEETYGVMVYQEDVIKVAHYFAGLSLSQADMLRRGMSGKFRSRNEFEQVKQQFFINCKAKGYSDDLSMEVWRQMESFAGYAFSKGHSASYAVESYQHLYLKVHHPMEFIVSILNHGGGFYSREIYLREAMRLGARVEAPCINQSNSNFVLSGENLIYIGFSAVKDIHQKTLDCLLKEREENGAFRSLDDFVNRCSVSKEQLSILIRIGAFRFCGLSKQALLWQMYRLSGASLQQLNQSLFQTEVNPVELPALDQLEHADSHDELELLGFTLCSPFALLKEAFPDFSAEQMKHFLGKQIEIAAYLVTIKNVRTANSKYMQFGTFLDRKGAWLDTVHFPYTTLHHPFQGKGCYCLKGKVVRDFNHYALEVKVMKRLS